VPNRDGSETYLEGALRKSIEQLKVQNQIAARRGQANPLTGVVLHPRDAPGALSLALGAYAPAEISEVKHAVTEGRLVKESLPKWGRLVERVVVTRAQLTEHYADGYEALFRWEEEQRALGRTVLFHDDVAGERVVFESREEA
jgi:hypothetical protein